MMTRSCIISSSARSSDRFDGLTGIDGHEFIIDYALMKNVTLGLDYYNVDRGAINQDLFQFDVVVKF